ncbi:esterase FE4 [Harpegnathos saltator]|uniref:esterase FE4 n=1 Tax=Harpegnathos saltator TaxID=610380 RepID=UPI000DBEE173|nr:esterase FE4 [Harpegnathos saltator]
MNNERSHKSAGERAGRIALRCVLALAFVLAVVDGLPSAHGPIINTKWGSIHGKWSWSINGRPIANFLGIPYALPPLGDLRFKSPQPWNLTWTTIHDGTVDGDMCSQLNGDEVIGSEDCLYLNVFMPVVLGDRPAKLPVMVFVHGGSFAIGSNNSTLYAPDYLLDHDVILVTLNYRLGVLGFFSTSNRVAPGNYGLKDMVVALQWVQENIHSFEGDPKSVTVMGSSAGAAATHLLAFSGKTAGLFHRYILHSGSALNFWSVHSQPTNRRISRELARLVGCLPTDSGDETASNGTIFTPRSDEERSRCESMHDASANEEQDERMMKCMRTVNISEMLNMTKQLFVWRSEPTCFITPTLEDESEDAIVTIHPLKVVRNGLFRDIPAIILFVKDEGLVKSTDFLMQTDIQDQFIENFEQYLLLSTELQEVISNSSAFADAIMDFYFDGNLTRSNLKRNITEMIGDGGIIWSLLRAVQYQSEMGNASIYFSFFDYQGTFSFTFNSGSSAPFGVCHCDELNYLFPVLNNMFKGYMLHNTENDYRMIDVMTEMWANFAKEGVPRAWVIPEWPDYRDHHQFMRFGIDASPDIVVEADFLPARMEFWEKLMANVSTECDAEHDDNPPENIAIAFACSLLPELVIVPILILVTLVRWRDLLMRIILARA